jgi:hypothetical protein
VNDVSTASVVRGMVTKYVTENALRIDINSQIAIDAWKLKMIKKTLFVASGLLALSSLPALADDDIDFSSVDCNSVDVRKGLIEDYDEILAHDGLTVVDTYNQKTLERGLNKLTCYGTYEFSDGDKLNVTYKTYKNSLNEFIYEFNPEE